MKEFKVGKLDVGKRADLFVASNYPEFTRSALKGLFEQQKIQLNQKNAKPGYRLKEGDKLMVDSRSLEAQPEPIQLPILYEDKDVIVLNKPTGILTHSKGALNLEPTVASFIWTRLNDKKMAGNRAGIVHRLDRFTSGVMICGRNEPALHWLQKQFSTRRVKKTYAAIVEGLLEPEAAIIDAPIGRNPKQPATFKVIANGKPAQTEYKMQRFFKKSGQNFSLVELKPLTGRTHQLRVHMAYIGHPVVGDAVYGHGGARLMLHAKNLELTLPSGQRKSFSASVPQEFRDE